ncbi:alpha/beta hydrolase [Hydrogenovibrio marinus]|uniref:alpha/beta hydrolase n=1 Tax=Hydrogenovibrio marinus TaxID=28885 RepID=UPI00068EDF3F|nr:carboxylesterase [Hydrogenovibrio marinus]BBN58821.1 phospholipase/carboxylesterase [Hydrogenovibrio marinus]
MSNTFSPPKSPIVIEPKQSQAENCVIWLHGLGADGHDFEGILPQLDLPQEAAIRFVFPTAPIQPVTVNLGDPMTAWYDIKSLNLLAETDWQGIAQSVEYVHVLIQEQLDAGIDSQNILLAGFSQGGVIALYAGLTYERPLAGIMALSTYFPDPEQASEFLQPKAEQMNLSVFYGHGNADPICPLAAAEASKNTLEKLGLEIEWHVYPMAHQVCYDEVRHISQFLKSCLLQD